MYGISSNVAFIKGYKKSFLVNFKNHNIFHIDNPEAEEVSKFIKQRFFKKEEVSSELINFFEEQRMIYKINSKISKQFPLKTLEYNSKHLIEYLVLDYKDDLIVQKVLKICSFFKIPNLIIVTNNHLTKKIDDFLSNNFYPESVTFISDNEKIYNRKNNFRTFYLKRDKRPFVNKDSMDLNYSLFLESQFYHNYFNKKIFIDKKGNIKNTPESEISFGNIYSYNITQVVAKAIFNPNFQKYWKVNKNICNVCKDCEFRYMCVDNRIPYQKNEYEWFHKTECDYNPYTATWKEET
ncbi:hypothetical protein ATO12_13565 [Aquimarina atlantica]|uniref:4Fe4S-binding SPASM domain-containing protein n=1 Tax=Aquimarina atlantica TaxID=1317122 RepID=A0A023BV78_9FLAO|nr:hypothetical protein [Aquimarina atlantica]EZH73906.1 hypothetical protein ATO12_13565 [Aquimarina atlantica]